MFDRFQHLSLQRDLAVIDLETTGVDPFEDRIVVSRGGAAHSCPVQALAHSIVPAISKSKKSRGVNRAGDSYADVDS